MPRHGRTQLGMIGAMGQYAKWEVGVYENRFIRQDGKWQHRRGEFLPARDHRLRPWLGGGCEAGNGGQRGVSLRESGHRPRIDSPGRVVKVARLQDRPAKPASSATVQEIPVLQQQLAAAIAVDAAENLMSSYGYYIDESAWDKMADTYASTGSKEITGAGVYVGQDRIRRILKLRGPLGGRTANFFTIHQLTQPVIHVSEDGSTRRCACACSRPVAMPMAPPARGLAASTRTPRCSRTANGNSACRTCTTASTPRIAMAGPGCGTPPGAPLAGRPASPRDVRGGGITQGLGGAASGPKLGAARCRRIARSVRASTLFRKSRSRHSIT